MDISVCMIVKNEDAIIDDTLKKLSCHFDEIIVVDTGSTDKTLEIVKKYTDKVYCYKWTNDFSEARNYSISKAKNDWILIVDADEFLIDYDTTSLAVMIDNKKSVGRVKRINPFNDGISEKKYIERVNRFFNKRYFAYEGIIHEQIVSLNAMDYETYDIDLILYHEGYSKDVLSRTNKIERNIVLLKEALSVSKEDPYLHYQLGKSYYLDKKYNMAVESFEMGLAYTEKYHYEYVEDLIITYGYALMQINQYKKGLELEEYYNTFSFSTDYIFLLSIIYMNNGMFVEAIRGFDLCTTMNEGRIEGVNSYLSNHNIGVIYEVLGDIESSLTFYFRNMTYNLSIDRVNSITANLQNNRTSDKILLHFKELVQKGYTNMAKLLIPFVGENTIDELMIKGVYYSLIGQLEKSKSYFLRIISIDRNNIDANYNLAYLYRLEKNFSEARKCYKIVLNTEEYDLKNEVLMLMKQIEI